LSKHLISEYEEVKSKRGVREALKKVRQELSQQRREEGAEHLFASLLPKLTPYTSVLCFAHLAQEIDTSQLNRFLARAERLLLPKVVGNQLKIYRITDLEKQLERGGPFELFEPIPSICEEVECEKIEVVLVPALGFCRSNHRIGYGKGYYDRFLPSLPHSVTIGIGYKEQLVHTLPTDSKDVPLSHINLF